MVGIHTGTCGLWRELRGVENESFRYTLLCSVDEHCVLSGWRSNHSSRHEYTNVKQCRHIPIQWRSHVIVKLCLVSLKKKNWHLFSLSLVQPISLSHIGMGIILYILRRWMLDPWYHPQLLVMIFEIPSAHSLFNIIKSSLKIGGVFLW